MRRSAGDWKANAYRQHSPGAAAGGGARAAARRCVLAVRLEAEHLLERVRAPHARLDSARSARRRGVEREHLRGAAPPASPRRRTWKCSRSAARRSSMAGGPPGRSGRSGRSGRAKGRRGITAEAGRIPAALGRAGPAARARTSRRARAWRGAPSRETNVRARERRRANPPPHPQTSKVRRSERCVRAHHHKPKSKPTRSKDDHCTSGAARRHSRCAHPIDRMRIDPTASAAGRPAPRCCAAAFLAPGWRRARATEAPRGARAPSGGAARLWRHTAGGRRARAPRPAPAERPRPGARAAGGPRTERARRNSRVLAGASKGC